MPLTPTQRRLSFAGVGVALFFVSLVLVDLATHGPEAVDVRRFGMDLLPSYTAGYLVRTGQSDLLYDASAFEASARDILARERPGVPYRFGAFLNPPFFAWVFVPLSCLPFNAASLAWLMVNLLLAGWSAAMLIRLLPEAWDRRAKGLVPLLILTSFPFLQTIGHLQNTMLSVAILSTSLVLLRSDRRLLAGMVLGLMLYKPQIAAGYMAAIMLAGTYSGCGPSRFRTVVIPLVGFSITVAILVLANAFLMPGTLGAFVTNVPSLTAATMQAPRYAWHRQATLVSFWRMLLQGPGGPTAMLPSVLAGLDILGLVLLCILLRARLGVLLAAVPLCMPYFMDYDLLLLAPAAVLLAPHATGRLTIAWVALAGCTILSSIAGHAVPLNLNATALAAVVLVGLTTIDRHRRETTAWDASTSGSGSEF
jgi:alpha-1,2-mannosyltransferase